MKKNRNKICENWKKKENVKKIEKLIKKINGNYFEKKLFSMILKINIIKYNKIPSNNTKISQITRKLEKITKNIFVQINNRLNY